MDLSIKTYCRLRPTLRPTSRSALLAYAGKHGTLEYSTSSHTLEDGTARSLLDLKIPEDADPGLVHNNAVLGCLRFEFDQVFEPDADQEFIFNSVAKDKVLEVLQGINCTIFAYGQTGSGKTFTMSGGDTFADRGIIPRTIGTLFEEMKRMQEQQVLVIKCHVSFTEVYKEVVYDLLDQKQRALSLDKRTPVQVLESVDGLVLRNVCVYEVSEEEDALSLFFMGNTNRISDATVMNSVSSRSHAVFTLLVESEGHQGGRAMTKFAKINLVDLAGSERMYKTKNSSGQLSEAKSINLSLHFLEQVILSLRDQALKQTQMQQSRLGKSSSMTAGGGGGGHVPYRNSVLTNILRDSLGGNCKSCFILTLSTERLHFEETVSTCRFGQRCGEVKIQVTANTESSVSDQLQEQTARVKTLERQIALLEEQRNAAKEALDAERAIRKAHTSMRALTSEEQATCKSRLKEVHDAAVIGATAQQAQGQEAADAVVLRSQEHLYRATQDMDNAVLVELLVSLAGLAESTFIENEAKFARAQQDVTRLEALPAKLELQHQQQQQQNFQQLQQLQQQNQQLLMSHQQQQLLHNQEKQQQMQQHQQQVQHLQQQLQQLQSQLLLQQQQQQLQQQQLQQQKEMPKRSKEEDDMTRAMMMPMPASKTTQSAPPPPLTLEAVTETMTQGGHWMKYGRLGIKKARKVYLSPDLTQIFWQHTGNTSNPSSVMVSDFISIEITGKNKNMLALTGAKGKRSLRLEYAAGSSQEETRSMVDLWYKSLSFCIERNNSNTSTSKQQGASAAGSTYSFFSSSSKSAAAMSSSYSSAVVSASSSSSLRSSAPPSPKRADHPEWGEDEGEEKTANEA